MDTLIKDLRYGLKGLLRRPAFTSIARKGVRRGSIRWKH